MIRRYYIPSRNVYEEDVRINNVRALSVANTVMTKTPPNACSARKDSMGIQRVFPKYHLQYVYDLSIFMQLFYGNASCTNVFTFAMNDVCFCARNYFNELNCTLMHIKITLIVMSSNKV